jgi:hypothetical protein
MVPQPFRLAERSAALFVVCCSAIREVAAESGEVHPDSRAVYLSCSASSLVPEQLLELSEIAFWRPLRFPLVKQERSRGFGRKDSADVPNNFLIPPAVPKPSLQIALQICKLQVICRGKVAGKVHYNLFFSSSSASSSLVEQLRQSVKHFFSLSLFCRVFDRLYRKRTSAALKRRRGGWQQRRDRVTNGKWPNVAEESLDKGSWIISVLTWRPRSSSHPLEEV